MQSARDRAKAVLVEIIRQNGGSIPSKTALYKAFWLAHVEYAKNHPDRLTHWPIVRMPNGPGIHDFDVLIGELMANRIVEMEETEVGDFTAMKFFLLDCSLATELSEDQIAAIKLAVAQVHGKSASGLSEMSHRESLSWQLGDNGDELDIALDAMSPQRFAEISGRIAQTQKGLAVYT